MSASTNSVKKHILVADVNVSPSAETFSLIQKARTALPALPYKALKDEVLGKTYVLSVVSVGTTRMKHLNAEYRSKSSTTDILSFPLGKKEGEIFLNPLCIRTRAKKHNSTYKKYVARLFIHGMLHLKGYAHGSTMDTEEMRILKRFTLA